MNDLNQQDHELLTAEIFDMLAEFELEHADAIAFLVSCVCVLILREPLL